MKTELLEVWDRLRTNYWFIPLVMVFLGGACSFLLLEVDRSLDREALPRWVITTPDAARETLSAITGAMISTTGTVFSITIVILSLTSQQFGPRLLRTFMVDRTTQFTLGIFLATTLYSALILRAVEVRDDGIIVPHLSTLLSVLAMVGSIITLIIFFHHIAVLIQAPTIARLVASDLEDNIDEVFPEWKEEQEQSTDRRVDPLETIRTLAASFEVTLAEEGYLQVINNEELVDLAEESEVIIRLLVQPGDFLPRHVPCAVILGECTRECQKDLSKGVNDNLLLGARRTPRQDIGCSIEELAEVTIRALSPAINDPFTAMTCINWLGAGLRKVAKRPLPNQFRFDSNGMVRLVAKPLTFSDLMTSAFSQIRRHSRSSVAVTVRLLEILRSIALVAERVEDRVVIKLHAEEVRQVVHHIHYESDRSEIISAYEKVAEVLRLT